MSLWGLIQVSLVQAVCKQKRGWLLTGPRFFLDPPGHHLAAHHLELNKNQNGAGIELTTIENEPLSCSNV